MATHTVPRSAASIAKDGSVLTTPTRRRRGPSRIAVFFAMLFLVGLTVYFLVPMYWLIVAASKSTGDLFSTNGFAIVNFNLWANIGRISAYSDGLFWKWMGNSLIYAVGGGALSTVISMMTGYALAKLDFRGKNILIAAILSSVLVPATVLVFPTYLLLAKMGMIDTYWGVMLPSVCNPFGVFLAWVYARSAVPNELLEAARIDGAGEFRTFWSVCARILAPGAATVFLFAFVGIWNNFFLPLIVLNSQDKFPVSLGLYYLNRQAVTIPDLQSLVIIGCLLSVIPLVLLFVTMQRFWRADISSGAVKV